MSKNPILSINFNPVFTGGIWTSVLVPSNNSLDKWGNTANGLAKPTKSNLLFSIAFYIISNVLKPPVNNNGAFVLALAFTIKSAK